MLALPLLMRISLAVLSTVVVEPTVIVVATDVDTV
jgi:hypothetical protein